jgi:tRNA A-37 threonylcarbamoyl transferase component Bud32
MSYELQVAAMFNSDALRAEYEQLLANFANYGLDFKLGEDTFFKIQKQLKDMAADIDILEGVKEGMSEEEWDKVFEGLTEAQQQAMGGLENF